MQTEQHVSKTLFGVLFTPWSLLSRALNTVQNYGVNNAQTQNKIVDVLSLTNGLLSRVFTTQGKTRRKETRQDKSEKF